MDYLLARRDEPCGRSAWEAILKAIAWVERVAEFEETLRATHGRLAWAAKDKITEILSEGARLIKRAPLSGLYADAAGGLGLRRGARYRLEDLGLPDQGSAMELELSQALIEVRRLTLFQGPALKKEDAQQHMRDLREENPAAATRASSPKGRAWLARGTSPNRGCYGPPPGRTSPRRRWPL